MDLLFLAVLIIIDGVLAAQTSHVQDTVDITRDTLQDENARLNGIDPQALEAAMTPPSQYVKELIKYILTVIILGISFLMHWYMPIVSLLAIVAVYFMATKFWPARNKRHISKIGKTLESRRKMHKRTHNTARANVFHEISTQLKETFGHHIGKKKNAKEPMAVAAATTDAETPRVRQPRYRAKN